MTKRKTTRKADAPQQETETKELSVQEVFDVLKFAQAAYSGEFRGIYTPDLINARLKDVSMSPQAATAAKIDSALSDPKNHEQELAGYSEWMELVSMLYRRILLYFSGLLSFDLTYVCVNAENEEDYDSKDYKKDIAIVADFFDRFNIKNEFRIAIKQMLRREVFFGILRDEGENFVLQELPSNYCKLTGRWSQGLVYDFNMYWFWQTGVDIDMYPPVFKRMYRDVYEKIKNKIYDPAASIGNRDGGWVYWRQTSPKDGFVAFKFTPEIATIVPFLSPLMADTVLQPVVRELQKNSYIAQAAKIIFGQVEFLKDTSSKVKDALTISPETLGKFLALIQAAIPSVVKVAAAPVANATGIEFKGDNAMYDSYNKATSSVSGVNSRLIYSFDRQNVLETKLSLDIDQNVLRAVYPQFENILNYWVNKRTTKFKFKFTLEGFNTSIDRAERLQTANTLAESGIVLEQKFASAIGMTPFDFRRMLAEGRRNKFVDKLTPIIKASQMPGSISKGRPEKSDGSLSDSGAQSRGDGTNAEKTEQ